MAATTRARWQHKCRCSPYFQSHNSLGYTQHLQSTPLPNSPSMTSQIKSNIETAMSRHQKNLHISRISSRALRASDSVHLRSQIANLSLLSIRCRPKEWDIVARQAGLIPPDGHVRPLQIECSNIVVSGEATFVRLVPRAAGNHSFTPYTSLGCEGETNNHGHGVTSIFIYSNRTVLPIFELAANGDKMAHPLPVYFTRKDGAGVFLPSMLMRHIWYTNHIPGVRHILASIGFATLVGDDKPLVPISATCPSLYQRSLITFAGLKTDYTLLNYGNFRPELSTVVLPLKYPHTTFKDLRFILPFGVRITDVVKTIIYSDDLELLTKMFWWVLARLAAAGLPAYLVDIIHAGLSEEHQRLCLEDFRNGRTKILLGSEKIGAGMNFEGVSPYQKWKQRKGRGGRGENGSAVGYLMPEKALTSEGELSVENPGNEDPGLIELIQSSECAEFITDRWLENPPRDTGSTCGQCYRCQPILAPGMEYEWITVDPAPADASAGPPVRTTEEEKEEMYQMLVSWRLQHWRTDWRDEWPSYGPRSLIPDSDLDTLAKHAGSIATVDDLVPLLQGVLHWDELAQPLLEALKSIFSTVHGPIELTQPSPIEEAPTAPTTIWDLILKAPPRKKRRTQAADKLAPGELLILPYLFLVRKFLCPLDAIDCSQIISIVLFLDLHGRLGKVPWFPRHPLHYVEYGSGVYVEPDAWHDHRWDPASRLQSVAIQICDILLSGSIGGKIKDFGRCKVSSENLDIFVLSDLCMMLVEVFYSEIFVHLGGKMLDMTKCGHNLFQ
ncbi:hypothetical protein B0H14DRAFT_2644026 [Mycena olivaceomarginata]|nr:hypothetical protein B0H14DRAFT_2644026 [Mycena olivaceomarginata]